MHAARSIITALLLAGSVDAKGRRASKANNGKGSKEDPDPTPTPPTPPGPISTCGHVQTTFVEAPGFINYKYFKEGGPRGPGPNGGNLADSLDYNVYQDPFFEFEDISAQNHAIPAPPFNGMTVAYLGETSGEHRGIDFNIRDQAANGPSSIGGFGPNIALADIEINHPDYGYGTIKVNGYGDVFGEGELAILGGTGAFVGATGLIRPYYGLIYMDDATLAAKGLTLSPGLVPFTSVVDDTPISFGFYLALDFICRGY